MKAYTLGRWAPLSATVHYHNSILASTKKELKNP